MLLPMDKAGLIYLKNILLSKYTRHLHMEMWFNSVLVDSYIDPSKSNQLVAAAKTVYTRTRITIGLV